MLKLQPTEPEWLDLGIGGVRVRFAPITIKAVRAAKEAVRITLGLDGENIVGAGDALSAELIKRGILGGGEWDGVGDRAGEPVPVNEETVALFLADWDAFVASDHVYVRPWANRDMEGNVSAGSPSGTGAAATPADDIASSPAAPIATADAAPTRKPAKRAARTSSTSRGRKKAKLSGMS